MTTGCPDRLGDLGAYALGGLGPDEAEALEAHLRVCAGCRAELAELEPLPDLLALADPAPPAAPPTSGRARWPRSDHRVDGVCPWPPRWS